MLISQLCKYHDIMEARGDVLPDGYSVLPMNYLVCLTPDGRLNDIIDMSATAEGKKTYPLMIMPERTQKPGIEANIVEHRPLYIFGLASDKGSLSSNDNKAKKSHAAFVKATLEFFADIDSPVARAYCLFAENWTPDAECENVHLLKTIKDYGTSRYAFCISGSPNVVLHNDNAVREKWEKEFARRNAEKVKMLATCSIFGKVMPVAVLHDKIKGVKGGQPSGCVLVCFNNDSESSYCKKQATNSGISEKAMKKYTSALNYLLSKREHRTYIDAMTVVHFALEKDEQQMLDFINFNIFDDDSEAQIGGKDIDEGLAATMRKIETGDRPEFAAEVWSDAEYCIAGLVPNSSRIAVKFCYRNSFSNFRKNVEKYHADFAVGDVLKAPPFWKIKKELISPKAGSAEVPPDVSEKLLCSMLEGAPFPAKVLQTVVRRIRTDSDTETNHFIRINDTRIGLLKACLIRTNKNKEEIPTMSLNTDNKNAAYLCGRTFAVLEKIQQDAASGKLNKTILDTYFSSACVTPASVFPRLFKLSQSHMSKLADGAAIYYDKMIGEILDGLAAFPVTLALEEQGNFILGYYQQKRVLYTKNNKSEEN